ncbi:MAG TPA: glycosyltransferase family 2 protein [Deltaproteobacteria bacterium]|nr:glycosyltransferase family 2 protein [Deltaproteobacteria bacterium]HPP81198.1 glycosyltransferase family 2 protein [Deltaproteobacteria bacterium]
MEQAQGKDGNTILSVVIPFYNEAESLVMVCEEVREAFSTHGDLSWELIMVDDGSTDGTAALMDGLAQRYSNFMAVHIHPHSGQSAALEAGFGVARGEFIATLDGDGQNDPHDIFVLLGEMKRRGVDMMCGIRKRRADNLVRRLSSRIANTVRSSVLKDNITDVGCSVRVFRRACLERVRFFRNAHRFFPALFIMAGYTVAETPVNHRSRKHGTSKYGGGINSRLWVGLADLAGVFWLRRRSLRYAVRVGHEPED